ncbi:riboflavin synthase [Mesoterricola sediminis]|uniref:Riboflavin synthase n=1 Tax=Mesoterricola sediminis TaxID=2927980 RepID=A0AA48KDJ6_9BACT|nr:riboflavin synthase [Mesoterricola sediminis]BDU78276.1 riboflavin synthase subunit alpha [Mesoterricola sediminis]
MFTGLIRHLGTLEARRDRPGGARLTIQAPPDLIERAEEGASICTNGACLTAVARSPRAWEADLSHETLARTTLGRLEPGALLHLEPALRVGDPLDGHLVSGHVDGVGQLLERASGEGVWRFGMPPELAAMMAPKGSVAVDGISLTVVDCGRDWFTVALIPETVRRTRLEKMIPGAPVNLEADPIGRFVARALDLRSGEERLARFAREGWA